MRAKFFIAYQPNGDGGHVYALYADRQMASEFSYALATMSALSDACVAVQQYHDVALICGVAMFVESLPSKPKMGFA